MSSTSNGFLGGLDLDYSTDDIEDFLCLLTQPAMFHTQMPESLNTQDASVPAKKPKLERTERASQAFNLPTYIELNASETLSLSPILPLNASTSTKLPMEEETFNDPILDEIKREFEEPPSTQQTSEQQSAESFEFDEDLEREFSSALDSASMEVSSTFLTLSSIKKEPPKDCTLKQTSFPADVTMIPSSVLKLYEQVTTNFSDFAFVYALSAQMCQDLLPMDSLVHLKLALLLSLASIDTEDARSPISVIAVGRDISSVNLLMTNIGNIARRFVTPTGDIHTGIVKDKFIQFGPVQMARSGVCYLGNWTRLKPAQTDKILKCIENGRAIIEGSMSMSTSMQCAVWTYWNAYKYNAKDQQTFSKFLEIFGIPVVLDDKEDEDIADFLFKQASIAKDNISVDDLAISIDELRSFVDVISKRKVDFSKDASEVLQKYFVASRSDREQSLSTKAFSVLKQMAESFAKLSCRHEVLLIDAIAAVYMTEQSLLQSFGEGSNPSPKPEKTNYIGDIDDFMNTFQIWLTKYIDNC